MEALIVTVLFVREPVPRSLTVMVGVVPARISLFVAVPPLSRIQRETVELSVSPKTKLPIVRGVSKVTVVSAVVSKVLKFAVEPDPSAITPGVPAQLPVALQLPPEVLVQVPSAACATRQKISAATATVKDLVTRDGENDVIMEWVFMV